MQFLKEDTAATVLIGPFVDKTDAVTPETGLAAGTVDEIVVYKHDGTAAVDISGTTTFTHRAGGMYTATLSTSDTETAGRLTLYVRDDSVCLPCWKDFMVLPSNVWNSLFSTDYLHVDVREIQNNMITAAAIATGAITSDEIAASAAEEIADTLLKRDWTSVSGEAARSVLNALRALRNKVSISGTTLTVTEEDDTTQAWTATVSTDTDALPIVGLDPA